MIFTPSPVETFGMVFEENVRNSQTRILNEIYLNAST